MERYKLIEEMAIIGCHCCPKQESCENCSFKDGMCDAYRYAEMLYDIGYRNYGKVASDCILGTETGLQLIENLIAHNDEKRDDILRLKHDNEVLEMALRISVDTLGVLQHEEHPLKLYKDYLQIAEERILNGGK